MVKPVWSAWDLYERMDRATIPLMVEMMRNGMRVDPQHMEGLATGYRERKSQLQAELEGIVGKVPVGGKGPHSPLPTSNPDIGWILYQHYQLTPPRVSEKTGAPSTDEEALKELQEGLEPQLPIN